MLGVLLGTTGGYWVLLVYYWGTTGYYYGVLLGYHWGTNGYYWVLVGTTGHYLVLLGSQKFTPRRGECCSTGYYWWVLVDTTGLRCYWGTTGVLLGTTAVLLGTTTTTTTYFWTGVLLGYYWGTTGVLLGTTGYYCVLLLGTPGY